MGRLAKPTKLKVLAGNPGKHPLPKNEPIPPEGKVTPPDHITGDLLPLWNELAAPLLEMGLLTVADVPTFTTLVEIESAKRALFDSIHEDEHAMRDYLKLCNQLPRLYDRFGLNPSARNGLSVNKPAVDPLRAFIGS